MREILMKRLGGQSTKISISSRLMRCVAGRVISKEIFFLAQLDVEEIHGYNPNFGLSVFTRDAIERLEKMRRAVTEPSSKTG